MNVTGLFIEHKALCAQHTQLFVIASAHCKGQGNSSVIRVLLRAHTTYGITKESRTDVRALITSHFTCLSARVFSDKL
jgi:hypothetical protein